MTTPPPDKQPAAETLEEIAERIVNELFQTHFGEQATRLELKQANGQHGERSLGGWNKDAARSVIERHLRHR